MAFVEIENGGRLEKSAFVRNGLSEYGYEGAEVGTYLFY